MSRKKDCSVSQKTCNPDDYFKLKLEGDGLGHNKGLNKD